MINLFMLIVVMMSGTAVANNKNVETIEADSKLVQLSRQLVDAAEKLELCNITNARNEYPIERIISRDAHYFFLTASYLPESALIHVPVNMSYNTYWEHLCATKTAFLNLVYSYQGSNELLNSCLQAYDNASRRKDDLFMNLRQKGYESCYHFSGIR